VKKTVVSLSDGRELIYFDAADHADRSQSDQRGLDRVTSQPELRYNQALDEWVIVSAHRQQRTFQPAAAECPLCPSRPAALTEIPASDYEVVVFENRFSALAAPAGDVGPDAEFRREQGRMQSRPATGRPSPGSRRTGPSW
jgi:UDPglucose--hexose-1-phosphate uridylyltransferase